MGFFKRIRGLLRTFARLVATAWRALRGAPLVGEIHDRFEVTPAVIDDEEFGRSSSYPQVLEIIVSDDEQWPLGVGKIVNDVFFDKDPPIVFNVCFSCHEPDDGRSEYADPTSHWFNVFFGFYEIDVPAKEWGRPFGFKSAEEVREIEFDDLKRIGKSDWNYFSNYMYGVPWWEVSQHNRLDDPGVTTRVINPRVVVKDKHFVECEVDGMEVVSGYCAGDEQVRHLRAERWVRRELLPHADEDAVPDPLGAGLRLRPRVRRLQDLHLRRLDQQGFPRPRVQRTLPRGPDRGCQKGRVPQEA
jgi:hypothetical protein